MRVRITSADTALSGTLDDTAAARSCAALLPLAVELRGYASTEKITGLPRRPSPDGVPEVVRPGAGDLTTLTTTDRATGTIETDG
ncbi:cyclophilin-like fold protein [Arthrobacter sp. GCM10027362]|uniref:cyclophilin-like fold protein n=1 Tax=Arthrobacter sp. GCM10027362 TaxID=3273379 RepID=UPI003639713F